MLLDKTILMRAALAGGLLFATLQFAVAQTLPPIFEGVQSRLLVARTVAERPPNTFLENLVIDAVGRTLVTSHEDGVIYQYRHGKALTAFAQVPGKVTGIAAGKNGELIATGADLSGKAVIFHVSPKGAVQTLLRIKDGIFLNGIAHLAGQRYLVADSYKGAIWLVDAGKRTATIWLQNALLERADEKSPFPAANGIKVDKRRVLVSNTAKQLLVAIPIGKTGLAGTPTVLKDQVNLDDFVVDKDGSLYGATHVYNSVIRVAPDGQITTIAGTAQGMTGSTAIALGKTASGQRALYVTTNGGMFLPPAEGVQPAKLVEILLPP